MDISIESGNYILDDAITVHVSTRRDRTLMQIGSKNHDIISAKEADNSWNIKYTMGEKVARGLLTQTV